VGFLVDKVALGQVFSPSTSVFSCQFHSIGTPLHIFIFITGLQSNKKYLYG
jgi:hypothetical protein